MCLMIIYLIFTHDPSSQNASVALDMLIFAQSISTIKAAKQNQYSHPAKLRHKEQHPCWGAFTDHKETQRPKYKKNEQSLTLNLTKPNALPLTCCTQLQCGVATNESKPIVHEADIWVRAVFSDTLYSICCCD